MQVASGYTDSNRMVQKTSTMGAGIISGKAHLDMDWIAEAMANGDDRSRVSYPGGSKEENHDAMPGYMSFGLKCVRSDGNELGVVSVAGLCTDEYSSQRSMEAQWYFQGFVTTEQRVSGHHMDANTQDNNNGYATIRVGLANTTNNGPFMLYAGQLACYRMPPGPFFTGKRQIGDVAADMSTQINQRARNGDPNTMWRWELVPFDHRDFTMYTAGALATITMPSSQDGGGISDKPFSEFFRWQGVTEVPTVSHEQEEGGGRKYGFIGAGLAFVETLAAAGLITINTDAIEDNVEPALFNYRPEDAIAVRQLAKKIGLWETMDAVKAEQSIYYKALVNMFFADLPDYDEVERSKSNISGLYGGKTINEIGRQQTVGNDSDANYGKLRVHLSRFTDGALMGAWYDKTSKIIGRACNTTAPGDMAHILAGHTAV